MGLIIYCMNPNFIPHSMDRNLNTFHLQQNLLTMITQILHSFGPKKLEKPLPVALFCWELRLGNYHGD